MISKITETTDTGDRRGPSPTVLCSALALGIATGCLAVGVVFPQPRWLVMWLIASALFFTCKGITLSKIKSRSNAGSLLAYLLLWPGLNPNRFLAERRRTGGGVARGGIVNLFAGCAVLWLVARQFAERPLIAGWIGMIGLVLVLHFGLFRLVASFWMWQGRDAEMLMRCPVAATSLSEFWGRRWNLAFRDVSHSLVFRPVSMRWGASAATWAVFGLSGLAHELVTSVPAGAGYGGPTMYFLLQSIGIALARRFKPFNSRLFTWIALIVPLGLLFHPPFVHRVMIPFFHSIGALP